MTPRVVLLALLALLLVSRVYASPARVLPSETPLGPDFLALANAPEFLPRTYVYGSSKVGGQDHAEGLWFAAEYALHLPIINTLRSTALRPSGDTPYEDERTDRLAYAISLFFRGDLRMYRRDSKPVVMPSYKPGLSLQGFWLHKPANEGGEHERRWLSGVRFEAYHYSNGQDQCTWTDLPDVTPPDGSPRCAELFATLRDPANQLNRVNGEFSTNRFLLALDTKYVALDSNGLALWSVSGGLTGESNRPRGPGGIEANYRKVYGWGTAEGHLEAERWLLRKLLVRLRATYTYAIDSGPNIPRSSGLAELSLYPHGFGQFGFFVRYYGGRDSYNAFFADSIQTVSGGLVWSDAPPLKWQTAMKR